MIYDRQGEEHYNTISALQKSIRASDDNAALYWTTRALHGGEDPLYIARRLVRTACEDIGNTFGNEDGLWRLSIIYWRVSITGVNCG